MFTIKIKKTETDSTRFQLRIPTLGEWLKNVEEMYNDSTKYEGYVVYLDFSVTDIVNPAALRLAQYVNIQHPLTVYITNEETNETTVLKNVHLRDVIVYNKELYDQNSKSITMELEFQTLTKLLEVKGG
jgi:hypothetical protein